MQKSTQNILIIGLMGVLAIITFLLLPIIKVSSCTVLERSNPGSDIVERSIPCQDRVSIARIVYDKMERNRLKENL